MDAVLQKLLEMIPSSSWGFMILMLMFAIWYLYTDSKMWQNKYLKVLEDSKNTLSDAIKVMENVPTKSQLDEIRRSIEDAINRLYRQNGG